MFAKELADLLVIKRVAGSLDNIVVDKLAQDSRKVVPNNVFLYRRCNSRRSSFAGKAKRLGANVFVASNRIKEQVGDSPVIYVKDVTRVMTLLRIISMVILQRI